MDALRLPPRQNQPAAIRLTDGGLDMVLSSPRTGAYQAINSFNYNNNGNWPQDPLLIQLLLEGDDM